MDCTSPFYSKDEKRHKAKESRWNGSHFVLSPYSGTTVTNSLLTDSNCSEVIVRRPSA